MAHDDKPFRWPGEPANADHADFDTSGDGEEVLRNWLQRAPRGNNRRAASFNPAVYTWKGYRQWKAGVDKQWLEGED